MDLKSPIVQKAIQFSPILTDSQRSTLLKEIAKGEPFSEELQRVVHEFTNAVIVYEMAAEELLKTEVEELEGEIARLSETQPDAKSIEERSQKIVTLTKKYLEEIKKMEKEFETNAESILKKASSEGESQQIESIHRLLNQSKKDTSSGG